MKLRPGWTITAILAVICGAIAASWKPWEQYNIQRKKRDAATAEMREAEKERAELTKEKARLESPIGKEELARERGFRRPGEIPLEGQ